MEPEAVVREGADDSSLFGATLEPVADTSVECSYDLPEVMEPMAGQGYDSSSDMPSEIGREAYSLRPGIEFSTDLRMELSADVLASLGGSSTDVEKPPEDNLLDICSMREDMQFISEFSSMSPSSDPVNSSDPSSFISGEASPHLEAEPGGYEPSGSLATEAQLNRPVGISTVNEFHLNGQVESALAENLRASSIHSSGFGSTSGAPVEPPSILEASGSTMSFAETTVVTGTSENIGLTPDDTCCPGSPEPSETNRSEVLYSNVAGSEPEESDNADSSQVKFDVTLAENEDISNAQLDTTSDLAAPSSSELESAMPPGKDEMASELGKTTNGTASNTEDLTCPSSEVAAIGSFQVPFEPTLSPGADDSSPRSPVLDSSMKPEHMLVTSNNQAKTAFSESLYTGDESLQAKTGFSESLFVGDEPFPSVAAHFQVESSVLVDHDVVPAKFELPEADFSLPAMPEVAPVSSGPLVDLPVGKSGARAGTVMLQYPVQIQDQPSPTVPKDPEASTTDAVILNTSELLPPSSQLLPFSSPLGVLESSAEPSLDGAFPSFQSFSVPAGDMLQPVDALAEPLRAISNPVASMPVTPHPDAADINPQPSPQLFKACSDNYHTSFLASARPGHFWDVPSSSARSLPSLPSLSAYFDGSRSPFRGRKSARRKKSAELVFDSRGKLSNEMEKMEEVGELESMVDAQKKTMQWQIDELQRVMMKQCQLTGKNPLSEEMVHEVLGEKGGETKPGELPSAEALKYLREVFAIKDTISKKEAREISTMTGATLIQIRDFFSAQRTLVKKLVQQVYDETGRVGIKNASEQSQQKNSTPINNIGVQKDVGFYKLTGVESMERYLELMREERTFFGQIQLLQIIIQTDSAALILRRFLEKGGLKVLGGWLIEAAAEEQTSVLRQLLKAFTHLPISHSVPHQMPSLVQNVNKLRFYHTVDVSTQARAVLAKWSKMMKQKSDANKPLATASSKSPMAPETSLGISIGGQKRNRDGLPASQGVPGLRKKKAKAEESVQPDLKASGVSSAGSPVVNASTTGSTDTTPSNATSATTPPPAKQRWSSTLQPSESAVAAVSVSRKRLASRSLGDQSKERRKVQLVEDKPAGKNLLPGGISKSTLPKNSRPLSTDDIYKAKKLQRLMQEPVTKSRRKAMQESAQPPGVEPEAAAKEILPSSKPGLLESSKRLSGHVSERAAANKRGSTFPSASDRSNVWKQISHGRQLENTTPLFTPTSSPDRTQRMITPTSSPDRPQLIMITPTSSPDRTEVFVNSTPSQDLPKMSYTAYPLHDMHQRLPPTSDLSSDTFTPALDVDIERQNLYRNDPSFSGGLTSNGPRQLSPYNSNLGGVHSVRNPELLHQQSEVSGSGFHQVNQERSGISTIPVGEEVVESGQAMPVNNLVPTTRADVQPSSVEHAQRSVPVPEQRFTGMITEPLAARVAILANSNQLPADGVEIERQAIGENSSSRRREPSVMDFYAALRANMIRWRIPPEYHLDPQWNVAAGEESKEKEMQSARVKREEEAYYPDASTIPDDPKDPWEEEPNYDDSLTFEIFLENNQRKATAGQQIQTDVFTAPVMNVMQPGISASSFMTEGQNKMYMPTSGYNSQDSSGDASRKGPNVSGLDSLLQQLSSNGGASHDPALLALLLQNPDLVNQLTSGQGGFGPSGMTNPNVFAQSLDPVKQLGNLGPVLRTPAGDSGQDRVGATSFPLTMVFSSQPGRAAPSVDQPSDATRVEDSSLKHLHTGMGHQQTPGFVPQAGVDNRYSGQLQMPPQVGNGSGWEQPRMPPLPPPPPPPPLPPMPSGGNQRPQSSVQPQASKVTSWPEPQTWTSVGAVVGRPSVNTAQIHSGPDQLHIRPQTIMTHNVRPPNYGGMVGMPQLEVSPVTSVVSQQEMHNASQRQWSNGSHLVIASSVNENAMIQAGQESGVSRNNRWPRPPGPPGPPPPDSQMRPLGRDFPDFQGTRQGNVAESIPVWVPNDRGRPGPPPFQGGYRPPPPPPPPPYPAPQHWQTSDRNVRPGPASAVPPFPLGRDMRPQQQPPQPWHPNMGPPRPMWRGP